MCEKCERQAKEPTAAELEAMLADVRHGATAIAASINANLGGARGPVEAAIRIAAARAWARIMEEGVELSEPYRALVERLVEGERTRCLEAAKQVDPSGELRAAAKAQVPPACVPPKGLLETAERLQELALRGARELERLLEDEGTAFALFLYPENPGPGNILQISRDREKTARAVAGWLKDHLDARKAAASAPN